MANGDRAISELMAEMFIAILVITLAMVIIGMLTGFIPKLLQKSALLSAEAEVVTIGGDNVISINHVQGDAVSLYNTSQNGGVSPVTITVTPPDNSPIRVQGSPQISSNAWKPGDTVYIYLNGGYFYVTDDIEWLELQAIDDIVPAGTWTVSIVDAKVDVLLQSLSITI